MIASLRRMITCRWSARRIQRYLDADPAAPLSADEVTRLEGHLAVCQRCTDLLGEHRTLQRALLQWPGRSVPDAQALERVHDFLSELVRDSGR